METLLKCRFMRIVLHGAQYDYDPNKLLETFQEFQQHLTQITDSDLHYRDKYRSLKSIIEVVEFRTSKPDFIIERGTNLQEFASMALRAMQVELDLLEKQIQYPSLFPKITEPKRRNALHWNHKEYSKTALMSLIVALDYVGACLDSKGDQAPFVAIVQTFEDALNIKLPNHYKTRDELLSQGDKRTKFLRQLLRALGSD